MEAYMEKGLPLGKITPDLFKEIIYPALGCKSNDVLVGPRNGVDIAITKIGGKVIATTTDPVFVVKEYGFEKAGWFAIHILVSDAVTSGLLPKFLSIDLNLPLEINKEELKLLWNTIHRECASMGIAVISGHTARYTGCNYPMVGGATVIAVGEENEYITPCDAKPGDDIVVTKGAAIEAAGLFAATFPEKVRSAIGEELFKEADKLFFEMSVVKDALLAREIGLREEGVTSMHDATEGGVLGGLYEVAKASGVGMKINIDDIILRPEVKAICEKFGMDPYISISEGSLIITVRPRKTEALVKHLRSNGIDVSVCGKITSGSEIAVEGPGGTMMLEHPSTDPFWGAFAAAFE